MKDYRRLAVWEKAHRLVLLVYQATNTFPIEERFGLSSQMRRAAVSIPSNLAEGSGRGSDADFSRFVRISAGSINELEYQSLLAKDLGYLENGRYREICSGCEETRRMLAGLLNKLAAGSW